MVILYHAGGKRSKFYQTIPVNDLEEAEQEMMGNEKEEYDHTMEGSMLSIIYNIDDESVDSIPTLPALGEF